MTITLFAGTRHCSSITSWWWCVLTSQLLQEHWFVRHSSGGKLCWCLTLQWLQVTPVSDTPAAASNTGVSDTPVMSSDTSVHDTPVASSDTGVPDTPVVASDVGVPNTPVVASDVGVPDTPMRASDVGVPDTPMRASDVGVPDTPVRASDVGSDPRGSKWHWCVGYFSCGEVMLCSGEIKHAVISDMSFKWHLCVQVHICSVS